MILPQSVVKIPNGPRPPLTTSTKFLSSSTHSVEELDIEDKINWKMSAPSPPEKIFAEKKSKNDQKAGTSDSSSNSNIIAASSKKSKLGKHICKLCRKSFACIYSAQRHLKYSCKKVKRPTPPPSESDASTSQLFTCAYCNHKFANRQALIKRHLMRCHPEMFFKTEKDASSLSKWKDKEFESIVKEIVIPKFIRRKKGLSTSCKCSICKKKYTDKRLPHNRGELTIHLIGNHLEEVRKYLKTILGQSDKSLKGKIKEARHLRHMEDGRGKQRPSVDESEDDAQLNVGDDECGEGEGQDHD